MTKKQIEIQTDLSYRAFVEHISQFGLELDPESTDIRKQAIESEVIKKMIAKGEECGHFFYITQYLTGN